MYPIKKINKLIITMTSAFQTEPIYNIKVSDCLKLVEKKCKNLFDIYTSKNDEVCNDVNILQGYCEFVDLLSKIEDIEFNYMKLIYLNPYEVVEILKRMGGILNIQFQYIKSDGITLDLEITTLKDMLEIISCHHVHSVVSKYKLYVCGYHQESLFVHLHLVMLICLTRLPENTSINTKLCYAFIGLMHDIGKYGTGDVTVIKGDYKTKFPFHGEIGSGILSMIWNKDYEKFFTKGNWEDMTRTICVHMCGYRETDKDSIQAKYVWSLLRLENNKVKNYLYYLSIGDHFGAIRTIPTHSDPQIFEYSRKDFQKNINEPFDVVQFYKDNGFHGFVIMVRGMSNSGKSTYVKSLINLLGKLKIKNIVIDGDQIMCYVAAKSIGEYCDEEVTGDLYKRYFEVYQSKKLAPIVNDEIKIRIKESLLDNKIVILHTVMSLFKQIDFAVPELIRSSFIIAIDIIRCIPFDKGDANKLGLDINQHIQLHGSRNNFFWLPGDTKSRLGDLSSCSTSRITTKGNMARPKLVYTIAWNEEHMINNDEVMRQITELVKPFIDNDKTEIKNSKGLIPVENDIVTYVNYLYEIYGYEKMCEFIRAKGFTVCTPSHFKLTNFENRIIRIKYLDNCRLWKPLWTRQCRGVVLYLNKSNRWVCLKYQLQRGAEVLTGLHLKAGIDGTENISIKELEILDEIQQDTIKSLLTGKEIEGVMTFKSDGSLMGIGMYSNKYYELMEELVTTHGSELSKTILKMSKELKLPFVPVLSSQTTFFLGQDMEDYMITSILAEIGMMDKDLELLAQNNTPMQIFEKCGIMFLYQLGIFYDKFIKTNGNKVEGLDVMTLNFEARCKRRKTAWGRVHSELAVSYETSGLKTLGISYGDKKIGYMAHYQFDEIINDARFDEPIWWKVSHSKDVEYILADLTKCIRNLSKSENSRQEFLQKHKPSNRFPFKCATRMVPVELNLGSNDTKATNDLEVTFDYEGFVFYRETDNGLDYSKIKTEEYYKSHKYKTENVKYLMELNETAADIFPLARIVKEFFTDSKSKLKNICDDVMGLLHKSSDENILFIGLSEKAKESFIKQNDETKMKMLVNASGDIWRNEIYNLMKKYFPSIERSSITRSEIDSVNKALIMTICPWSKGYEDRISKMIDESDTYIANLFNICINSE